MTEEQAQQIPQVKEMIDEPPDWLEEWSRQIGAELKDGLREAPAGSRSRAKNGTVYHTYTVMAPDPFVARTTAPSSTARRSAAAGAAHVAQDEYPEPVLIPRV